MAIPLGTKIFADIMDPYEVLDFQVNLAPLLESGEAIAAHSVTIPTESSLLGLTLNPAGYSSSLASNVLKFWLSIALAEQANAAFVNGAILPIEISITTNATPARKKQRTVAVTVQQR